MKFAVVVAKCGISKQKFAINLAEHTPGVITATSTFPISEQSSLNQDGNDQAVSMVGRFELAPEYACAHCKGKSFVLCRRCNKTTCYDYNDGRSFTCAHCNVASPVAPGLDALSGRPGG